MNGKKPAPGPDLLPVKARLQKEQRQGFIEDETEGAQRIVDDPNSSPEEKAAAQATLDAYTNSSG